MMRAWRRMDIMRWPPVKKHPRLILNSAGCKFNAADCVEKPKSRDFTLIYIFRCVPGIIDAVVPGLQQQASAR